MECGDPARCQLEISAGLRGQGTCGCRQLAGGHAQLARA
jgi:hypothetical protein